MNELDDVKVGSIATRTPYTVGSDMPVTKAAEKMLREKVHSLVVTGPAGKVVGLVTAWDVLKISFMGEKAKDIPVSKVIEDQKFFFVYTEVSLRDALNLMIDKNVRALPVLDESENLVGKISLTDVARFVKEKLV